jgi:hypothetical protein
MIKATDTARAIEHLRDALQSLEYAANRAPTMGALQLIEDAIADLRRLMGELEGEE